MISKEEIKKVLPHREPFLLIDEILEYEEAKSAVGVWHLSHDYPVFKGHFPGNPVLPGVLMVEALAQTGAYAMLKSPEFAGKLALFGGIKTMKFRKTAKPGDDLILKCEIIRKSSVGGTGSVRAEINGECVCEGEIMFVFAKS
jgi:3-hydroxyacyl-[acyl-carrier-protein] dehydratase